jgi:arginine-tRNA-protein transferase
MQFRVLWDQLEPCPYRDNEVARLPLRLPMEPITPADFDQLLEEGDRRSGRMLYRTHCPACTACHPLRVPINRFLPSRSQRRAGKQDDIELKVGRPLLTRDRLKIYNRHKIERNLSTSKQPLSAENYRSWLVDTCVNSLEFQYWIGGKLAAISILDIGLKAVSSVYHYFDPDFSDRSLGVYSVIRELAWCKEQGFEWYYLGFFVSDCTHLNYKASYFPHQRKQDGVWVEYNDRDDPGTRISPAGKP